MAKIHKRRIVVSRKVRSHIFASSQFTTPPSTDDDDGRRRPLVRALRRPSPAHPLLRPLQGGCFHQRALATVRLAVAVVWRRQPRRASPRLPRFKIWRCLPRGRGGLLREPRGLRPRRQGCARRRRGPHHKAHLACRVQRPRQQEDHRPSTSSSGTAGTGKTPTWSAL